MHSSAWAGGLGEDCSQEEITLLPNPKLLAFHSLPELAAQIEALSKPHTLHFSGDLLLLTNSSMSSGLQKP